MNDEEFQRLREKALKYQDLAFVRPLTDEEHSDFRALMEKMYGKENIRRALGGNDVIQRNSNKETKV